MAAALFSRRIARAACAVRTLPREGIGSVAQEQSRDLERPWAKHRSQLEALHLSRAAFDRHESGIAWHAGYVPDVLAAFLASRRERQVTRIDRLDDRCN